MALLEREKSESLDTLIARVYALQGKADSTMARGLVYRIFPMLRDERDRYKEALESIASKHKPRHAEEEYWLKIDHAQCATVLATDTKIARNALAECAVKPKA